MKKVYDFFIVTLVVCLLTSLTIEANAQRDCQTMEYLEEQKSRDEAIPQRMQEIERHTQQCLLNTALRSEQKIIIPVVVHIVYANEEENLPLEQITSQIDVLNEDFQRLNADQDNTWPQAANINIEFRLAELDPEGKATTGVIRKFTDRSYFNSRRYIKYDGYGGSDAWPSTDYLNIWVGDLYGRQMGYAQFPGGGLMATDGVVIDYAYFGRKDDNSKYGLGRTCTHEVGHWLNLRHIWGDGDCNKDDYVDDTPSASLPTFGCHSHKNSCPDGERDMTENFMDYTNDPCMNLFTEGQKARMRALFMPGGFRASILESSGIIREDSGVPNPEDTDKNPEEEVTGGEVNLPPPVEEVPEADIACGKPKNLSATASGNGYITSWDGDAEKYDFQVELPSMKQWFSFVTPENNLRISGLPKGVDYTIRIKSICADDTESEWAYFTLSFDRWMTLSEEIVAWPNPTTDHLAVEWDLGDYQFDGAQFVEVKPVTQILMYNMMGAQVLSERLVGENLQSQKLNLGQLGSGLYLLMLVDESGQLVGEKKIVVR